MELTALKVRINRDGNGAVYPDFNQLLTVQAANLDWAHYVDIHGAGWHYDQTSGHDTDSVDSPRGQQWGMLLVPDAFATEAASAFPATCTVMTGVEAENFYNARAHINDPEERRDAGIVESLEAELRAKIAIGDPTADVTAKIRKALDPNDPAMGVRSNPNKTLASFRARTGTTIKR